ncbi:MAG: tetratricopeptide repeat protein [Candidatus Hydrogenedentales bacterium]
MAETEMGGQSTHDRPSDADILMRAEEFFWEDRLDDALRTVRTLYGRPLSSTLRGNATALEASCLDGLDRREEAEDFVAKRMEEEGNDLAFVQAAGVGFFELGDFDWASVFFENLIQLDPENAAAWFQLGHALGLAERHEEALAAFEAAERIEPHLEGLPLSKAQVLLVLARLDAAYAHIQVHLEQAPDHGGGWFTLAEIELRRGRLPQAFAAYARAADCDEDERMEMLCAWADAAYGARDAGQLTECYRRLAAEDESDWRTSLAAAYLDVLLENTWDAWENMQEAFEAVWEQEEDEEAFSYLATIFLNFLRATQLVEHAQPQIQRLFEEDAFTFEMFRALRPLLGRYSGKARPWHVTVQSNESGRIGRGQYRDYFVYADKEQEAGDLAVAFESRCFPGTWRVHSVQAQGEADEQAIGVVYYSAPYDEIEAPSSKPPTTKPTRMRRPGETAE